MGLFSEKKKKTEPVNILSESEIQKKLYGEYKSGNVTEAQNFSQENRQDSSSATRVTVEHPNEGQTSLFDSSEHQTTIETSESSPETSAPTKNPQDQQIEDWIEEENETVSEMSPAYTSSTYKPEKPKSAIRRKPAFDIKKALGVVLEASMSFLQIVLGAVASFLLLFDLRKPKVRGFAYFLGALAFVAVLLAGINFLNVQREEAMMGRSSTGASGTAQESRSATGSGTQATSQVETPVAANAEESAQSIASAAEQSRIAKNPYVIQVATYATENDATQMASELRSSDLTSFVKPLSRPNGKQYYCVFLGRYANYQEAEKALTAFKRQDAAKPFQDAFIRTLNK